LARQPDRVYLTHYGSLGDVAVLGAQQLQLLDEVVALGHDVRSHADRHRGLCEGLRGIYRRSLRAHGCQLADEAIDAALALDIELNAQGMAVWLDRPARA
jgi:hypothetical protein